MASSSFFVRTQVSPMNPLLPDATQRSASMPTMSEIMDASRTQGLRLRLQSLGPFFRVRAEAEGGAELGRAEGVVRPWVGGKVLHLDSMRLSRDTRRMDRSIFGFGLFIGAAAVRHGFDRGCRRAELLAINDSPLFHSKEQCTVHYYLALSNPISALLLVDQVLKPSSAPSAIFWLPTICQKTRESGFGSETSLKQNLHDHGKIAPLIEKKKMVLSIGCFISIKLWQKLC